MLDKIINTALSNNKHILILGSARSGTHALGAALECYGSFNNLAEVCNVDGRPHPWHDILRFYKHDQRFIGHIVGFTSKIKLSSEVAQIKKHCVVVNIKRNNKVEQFASWMYFHKTQAPFELWHNHKKDTDMLLGPNSIEVTPHDIDQFIVEQIVDDFFLPDFVVDYENTNLDNNKFKKNQFGFDLKQLFSNLDFVEHELGNWHYSQEHYKERIP